MNTNDFSKCRVGEKLWFDQLYCEVTVYANSHPELIRINDTSRNTGLYVIVKATGFMVDGYKQVLYFGKPQVIAPPEPPRLPDYKEGQWIAVWHAGDCSPILAQFRKYVNGNLYAGLPEFSATNYSNHCTIEELPEVLAKWGEQK